MQPVSLSFSTGRSLSVGGTQVTDGGPPSSGPESVPPSEPELPPEAAAPPEPGAPPEPVLPPEALPPSGVALPPLPELPPERLVPRFPDWHAAPAPRTPKQRPTETPKKTLEIGPIAAKCPRCFIDHYTFAPDAGP